MLVRTIRGHSYGGRRRNTGDEYHIDKPKHAKILKALKKIEEVPELPVETVVVKKVKPRKAKRRSSSIYSRKDMRPIGGVQS